MLSDAFSPSFWGSGGRPDIAYFRGSGRPLPSITPSIGHFRPTAGQNPNLRSPPIYFHMGSTLIGRRHWLQLRGTATRARCRSAATGGQHSRPPAHCTPAAADFWAAMKKPALFSGPATVKSFECKINRKSGPDSALESVQKLAGKVAGARGAGPTFPVGCWPDSKGNPALMSHLSHQFYT